MNRYFIRILFVLTVLLNGSVRCEIIDFTELSLEELKHVEIITVSKKPKKLMDAAAAVFVITQEDIRRAGVTNIPDALRMVPGVQVARINGSEWAVTIRGLNEPISNKLLVLIDGRSVYSPVFSGVLWDHQDTIIDDIDRIEVIRGPGATLWGANAVNGVINIITQSARQTQKTQIIGLEGTEEEGASVRVGKKLPNDFYYRLYAKYLHHDSLADTTKQDSSYYPSNTWKSIRGGFRMDKDDGSFNPFTLQGEFHVNRDYTEIKRILSDQRGFRFESDAKQSSGGHILGRLQNKISQLSDITLQVYYDYSDFKHDLHEGSIKTCDLDLQHRFAFGKKNEVVWGLGVRVIKDQYENLNQVTMVPSSMTYHVYNTYIQDEWEIISDWLILTLGSKFEYNDFTKYEIQPGIRFMLTPDDTRKIWGAVSKAVRIPSRLERNAKMRDFAQINSIDQKSISILRSGNENLSAETLISYELGYSTQINNQMLISMASFFNSYDNLISLGLLKEDRNSIPPHERLAFFQYDSLQEGESYGFELAADWQFNKNLQFRAAYTYLETELKKTYKPEEEKYKSLFFEGTYPNHQISVRSLMNVTDTIECDFWFRSMARLSETDIGGYSTLDARLGWKPIKSFDISIIGQNLFLNRHAEFSSLEVERSGYLKLSFEF